MKKHILICGEKGVGKSTLIRRLVEEARLTVGGFCTKMDENAEGAMRPIYIYPASLPTDQRIRGKENLVGRCGNFGRQKEIFPEVFNALGTAYLQGTPSCQVIIMDELGFMESDAQAFRRAVLRGDAGAGCREESDGCGVFAAGMRTSPGRGGPY